MRRRFWKFLLLLVIDIILSYVCVRWMDLESSTSLLLLFLIPLCFVLNLVIAGVCAIKKWNNTGLFFMNALVAPIILYYMFGYDIDRKIDARTVQWSFSRPDTVCRISIEKSTQTYYMDYIIGDYSPELGGTGVVMSSDGNYLLMSATDTMQIIDGKLIGFQGAKEPILLQKR